MHVIDYYLTCTYKLQQTRQNKQNNNNNMYENYPSERENGQIDNSSSIATDNDAGTRSGEEFLL